MQKKFDVQMREQNPVKKDWDDAWLNTVMEKSRKSFWAENKNDVDELSVGETFTGKCGDDTVTITRTEL